MSQRKQQPRKPSVPEPKAPASPPQKPAPEKASLTTPHDGLLRKVFYGLAGVMLLLLLALAPGSGINADDEYQVDYSEKLVRYYATMGADTAALNIPKGNMHLYGGLFDLTAGTINHGLGYTEYDAGYHTVRHLLIALFGFLALLFTGLLAKEIGGWRAGILALLLLFLSPRFLGHSLMNPKDIPFAAGFAISLYYLARLLRELPQWSWRTAGGLTAGIAIALATRSGGLMLIGYLGLFAGFDFLAKANAKKLPKTSNALLNYASAIAGIAIAGYFLAVLTWPAALVDPLRHPLASLAEFSKLGVRIRVLFMGDNVLSDGTPWYYPVLWIAKTIPLLALVGFAGGMAVLPLLWRRYQALPVLMVAFAAVFPLAYIIYKDSLLHDGWRHLLFVYPAMVVLAALFWTTCEHWVRNNKIGRYVVIGVVALGLLEPAVFISRNRSYPYVYFNPIGGGLHGAYGNYETDYWGVSAKQAINWMKQEGIIRPDMTDTLTIGTSLYFNVSRQLGSEYKDKVKVKYVRFNNRYSEAWDYGIFPSRYIRGPHLLAGSWPNDKTVHTIKANSVPLLAVEKEDPEHHAYKGDQAVKQRAWDVAIAEYQQETAKYPKNELAWLGLANSYVNAGKNDEALKAADQALKLAPDNENGLYYRGLILMQQGNTPEAGAAFERLIEVNDEFPAAYYYLANIYQARGDALQALKYLEQAIKLNPRFKEAYLLAAQILEQQGDAQTAAQYRQAAAQF